MLRFATARGLVYTTSTFESGGTENKILTLSPGRENYQNRPHRDELGLRLSFNAGSIIARPTSVHGFAKLCWATTNITLFRATRLSCAPLPGAFVGCGGVFWSAAANAPRCDGHVSPLC